METILTVMEEQREVSLGILNTMETILTVMEEQKEVSL